MITLCAEELETVKSCLTRVVAKFADLRELSGSGTIAVNTEDLRHMQKLADEIKSELDDMYFF
jgi:hypothetical protein